MDKKTIGDLIRNEWNSLDKPNNRIIQRIIKQLKETYPIIHSEESDDYLCMKDRGEKCGGYCPQCCYGAKLR
jgi:hypothetical protein